jgi:hypothetical protein
LGYAEGAEVMPFNDSRHWADLLDPDKLSTREWSCFNSHTFINDRKGKPPIDVKAQVVGQPRFPHPLKSITCSKCGIMMLSINARDYTCQEWKMRKALK